MAPESRSTLATVFAVFAVFVALVASAASSINAVRLSKRIQAQRTENIVSTCQSQNVRNRKAYVFLSALPVDPRAPRQTPGGRTKLIHGFTDALVGPIHADCTAYAKSLTHS